MCGIVGYIARPDVIAKQKLLDGIEQLRHRGPDASSYSILRVGDWEVGLGHTRLAILDLSESGVQPFRSAKSKAALTYNGEIYNFEELRQGLDFRFRTTSDTEVLYAGLLTEGPSFIPKMNGMFAFAYCDPAHHRVVFARDRVGKKPLYVYQTDDLIVFGSELKALLSFGIPTKISELSLSFFHWLGYIPQPHTIYQGVTKFAAGSWGAIDLSRDKLTIDEQQYWDPLTGYGRHFSGTADDAVDQLLELVDEATRIRLRSDVPLGVFLSGGIDSSLVLSSVTAQASDVTAFTVGVPNNAQDESAVAVETARELGVHIQVLEISRADYARQIPRIPAHFDEPFSDMSQIPTMAIAELARQHVTVVLTGDGGDETFLGYPWVTYPERLMKLRRGLRGSVPSIALNIIERIPGFRAILSGVLEMGGFSSDNIDIKLEILRRLFEAEDPSDVFDPFKQVRPDFDLSVSDRERVRRRSIASWAQTLYPDYGWTNLNSRSLPERLSALEQVTYMRDDVLVKVDRATMAFGLEARSPLLDYRVIEFGNSLPVHLKLQDGVGKWLLRRALRRRLPNNYPNLSKRGFGVPFPKVDRPGPTEYAKWNREVEAQWRVAYAPRP